MIAVRLLTEADSRIRAMFDKEEYVLAALLEPHFKSCRETRALPWDDRKAAVSGEEPEATSLSFFSSASQSAKLLGTTPESTYGTVDAIAVTMTAQY